MNNYEMDLKFLELFKEMSEVKTILESVFTKVNPEEVLWDNSDIIRNWKVSERTLADWRKKELISYVQVQGKIWYPRNAREEFLSSNFKASASTLENPDHNRNLGISNETEDDIICFFNEGRARS